jgi:hypothetical protein
LILGCCALDVVEGADGVSPVMTPNLGKGSTEIKYKRRIEYEE